MYSTAKKKKEKNSEKIEGSSVRKILWKIKKYLEIYYARFKDILFIILEISL
jgi:hypothetical protein